MEKNFNIVYDIWFENNSVPNCKNLYGNRNNIKDPYNLVLHYTDDTSLQQNKFKIKKCKISDLNDNENYYYIINYGSTLSDLFIQKNNDEIIKYDLLTNQVKEYVKEKNNFYVIFLSEHEPDDIYGFQLLNDYINKNNLNSKKFYLINNNSNLENYKIKFNSEINVYKLNFIPHSFTKVLTRIGGCQYSNEKIGKFFMCFNKSPKRHRFALLILLLKNNLLNDFNWSLVPTWDCKFDKHYLTNIFSNQEIKELDDEINFFKKLNIKISDHEIDKNYFQEYDEINNETFPKWLHVPESIESYENSYINIVTESAFETKLDNIHISEKSLKPFYYYQYPLILSTPFHIKKMKEVYNLDFFDDIINHDYDDEINDGLRLKKFVNEIVRINNSKQEFINFYKNNKERFLKNKKIIEDILNVVDKDYLFLESLI